MVLITRGTHSTIWCLNGQLGHVQVHKLPKEKVVDTNGCGDSFLGGLFAHFVHFKSIRKIFVEGRPEELIKAIEFGNRIAALNAQVEGVDLPGDTVWNIENFDFK